jgi:hypothetical protein
MRRRWSLQPSSSFRRPGSVGTPFFRRCSYRAEAPSLAGGRIGTVGSRAGSIVQSISRQAHPGVFVPEILFREHVRSFVIRQAKAEPPAACQEGDWSSGVRWSAGRSLAIPSANGGNLDVVVLTRAVQCPMLRLPTPPGS